MENYGKPRRLSSLRLKNIRGFEEFQLGFEASDEADRARGATLVIGRNGTNKSTLLRSIVIGLADPNDATALLSLPNGSFVRHRQESAEILVTLAALDDRADTIELRKTIEHQSGRDVIVDSVGSAADDPGMFVVAYGQGRFLVGKDSGRSYRIIDSTDRLFDYRSELIDPEVTLRRLRDFQGEELYGLTLAGIKRVLAMSERDQIELGKGGGVFLFDATSDQRVPLEGWADGYRSTFTWLLDLYAWALRADRIDNNGGVVGTVLLDEVGQHLHPSLQASILPTLKKLLPQVQFVITTHSPIVALGAEPWELVVLRIVGDRVVRSEVPDFRSYSAEDMLADTDLFDSDVVRPQQRKDYERYLDLVKLEPDEMERHEPELKELVGKLDRRLITPADERLQPGTSDAEILAELREQAAQGS